MKEQWCWLATEIKSGWRLKLCIGSKDFNLKGLVLKTTKDVEVITQAKKGKIVFIQLKNSVEK